MATLQTGAYTDASGHRQTYYLDTDHNRQILATNLANISEGTKKWTCVHYSGIVSGAAFFVSTIILIGCAASQCYTDTPPTGNWCRDSCSLAYWVPTSVISGIASCIFSKLACCTK